MGGTGGWGGVAGPGLGVRWGEDWGKGDGYVKKGAVTVSRARATDCQSSGGSLQTATAKASTIRINTLRVPGRGDDIFSVDIVKKTVIQ
jgi:hypothetical protein